MDLAMHQGAQASSPTVLSLIHAAFNAVPEGLILIEHSRVLTANPAAARLLAYDDPAQLVGRSFRQFFSQGQFCRDVLEAPHHSECEHPSCESTMCRADQQEIRVAVRCTHFAVDGRSIVLTAFHESRRAEIGNLLWTGEPRFRAIFESAGIGIAFCTLDGRIIESNPAFSRMLACTASELVGLPLRDLQAGDFGQDQAFRELIGGSRGLFDLEGQFRRKDGSSLDGHVTVSLVRDSSGQPAYVVAMLEDTTARKRAEERVREAEKMEVIGRLAGGIAHDFNNLLTGVLLYCDLLLAGMRPEDKARRHAEEIHMAAEQGAALTQQLLAIARKQAPAPRPVRLNDVISSTENLLRRLIGEHVQLALRLAPRLGPVLTDPGQLRQVFLNLALNARDAMPDGGRITIQTRLATMPGSPDHAVELRVSDKGCGMDAQTRARLFEPFFTTKKPGSGTGLGLLTVQRIVNEAGGTIQVVSEPGRGTTVSVFLPVTHPLAQERPHASRKNDETILVVEDTASARRSMQRVLRAAGFRVLSAPNGKKALAVFNSHQERIDLLLADWMMPGMSGGELAEKLSSLKPSLKVLLVSGYQGSHDIPAGCRASLIRKPFAGNALIGRIRAVLNHEGERTC